ncbi:hypothetical protein EG68_00237 [Paragonimus skrjabini miyazakii]|uniref:Uncharacterized protein n=1 Tax=Paragonimus skrjabini miyazakii TaxID=59628 RepID=A0A8S9Z7B4_9TREM|nr:hypothetical protein EG68_00237 [Paragonimus skrjabini miyazakii]
MSVNELQDDVLSNCGSVSTSAGGRELKLARIRIQQLELQLALKDKMEQCRIEYEDDVKMLNEHADSVISDHPARKPLLSSLPQSSTSPAKPHCCAMEQGCNNTKPTDSVLRVRSEHHRELGLTSELGNLLSICMGLPKKELKKFSVNPMDHWGFIRSFMSGVDRYTDDFANRLSYLIQYCDGEALDAIKGCTVLKPESGYNEAISILQRRFGEPYIIARCYIRSLAEGCILKQDDEKGLTDLAEKMKMCATTLRQLHYESDMNSCRTLRDIVRRLPTPTQSKWFELATTILRHGREPSFTDLTSLALKHAIKDNLDAEGQFTTEMLQRAFYVDDCLMSVSPAKEMQAVALLLESILLKGGFRLTKFYSNVKGALNDIPVEDLSSVTVNLDRQQTVLQKAL